MRNGNKRYPRELKDEVEKTLSYYPELKGVHLYFRWGRFTQRSFMLAQPLFSTLLLPKEKRQYQIVMRKKFFLKNRQFSNRRVPSDVIVGWLGHELGHVLDYRTRPSWNLIWFGIFYYLFKPFIRKAEITADRNAVKHGLIQELVLSKEFGRNPDYFPKKYINKLNGLYPSIETVKEWDKELNAS